jgi:hypothetical protein
MRRTSIVGPILLIGVGALFLLRNLYPDLPLIDYVAQYWPYLLIAWGALRLGEILIWAATSKPLPRYGISGPEWALVLFLCFFGGTLHAVRSFPNWWNNRLTVGGIDVFGESFDYPVSAEMAASKTPRVVVENFRGSARIVGGDADVVKVTGHKTVRSLTQSSADRASQEAPLELTGDANQVIVRTNQDRRGPGFRLSSDLDIVVPKGASIEAHGRAGDFDISGITGSVTLSSENSSVRLDSIGGAARIDLRGGNSVRAANLQGAFDLKGRGSDIDLENINGAVTISGAYTGLVQLHNLSKPLRFQSPIGTEMNMEQLPGQARMTLGDFTASDLVGPVRLTLRSRDVQISGITNSLELNVDRGDIRLRPGKLPMARMDVHTRSGDIEVSAPPDAKFDLTANTARGGITNEYGESLVQTVERRSSTLHGSIGGGGATVNLRTDRGQIVVRKASPDDPALQPREDLRRPFKLIPPVRPLKKIEQ